jgi:hypothetical protein
MADRRGLTFLLATIFIDFLEFGFFLIPIIHAIVGVAPAIVVYNEVVLLESTANHAAILVFVHFVVEIVVILVLTKASQNTRICQSGLQCGHFTMLHLPLLGSGLSLTRSPEIRKFVTFRKSGSAF